MFNIAVLASTNGTDLQAIIDQLKSGNLPGVNLEVVISDQKDCYALKRAKEQGFKTVFIDPKNLNKTEFDQKLLSVLESYQLDLIVLVGYMRILTEVIVSKYSGKIINVHPSLIPKYSGKGFYGQNVHQAVLDNGDLETGMTIHFVDSGVDTGKIIIQKSCPVFPEDNPESLKHRVQELEKEWYPKVINQLAEKKKTL